jgi:Holliday junction DNA helicase RuvA
MIGFLAGTIFEISPNYTILLVAGVGYKIYCSLSTLTNLKQDAKQAFFIHTHVRDDDISLFGFLSLEELELFELLLTVSGIGPKTGLLVIDKGVDKVKQAISQAEVDFFGGIPRLGKKNSQKIIIELKNKIGATAELDLKGANPEFGQAALALQTMGYSKIQALEALKLVDKNITDLSEIIRLSLKSLAKKNG